MKTLILMLLVASLNVQASTPCQQASNTHEPKIASLAESLSYHQEELQQNVNAVSIASTELASLSDRLEKRNSGVESMIEAELNAQLDSLLDERAAIKSDIKQVKEDISESQAAIDLVCTAK